MKRWTLPATRWTADSDLVAVWSFERVDPGIRLERTIRQDVK